MQPVTRWSPHELSVLMEGDLTTASVTDLRRLLYTMMQEHNLMTAPTHILRTYETSRRAEGSRPGPPPPAGERILDRWEQAAHFELTVAEAQPFVALGHQADVVERRVRQLHYQALWPLAERLITDRLAGTQAWPDTLASRLIPPAWEDEGVPPLALPRLSRLWWHTTHVPHDLILQMLQHLWTTLCAWTHETPGTARWRREIEALNGMAKELVHWQEWVLNDDTVLQTMAPLVIGTLKAQHGVETVPPHVRMLVGQYADLIGRSPVGDRWVTPEVVGWLLKSPVGQVREVGLRQMGRRQ